MPDFKLPDLGEGVTEAEVDKWLVKEGDTIAEDDPLVELITDKATAEVPSPFAGVVTKIHVQPGEIVPVGTVLVSIGDESAGPGLAPAGRTPNHAQAEPHTAIGESSSSRASVPTERTRPSDSPITSSEDDGGGLATEIKAMPPVRRLARELDVDLAEVAGSGADGSILRSDVIGYAATSRRGVSDTAARDARVAVPVGGRREPFRGVRRKIAERMSEAHRVIPPVTHVEECDVTELEATRNLANQRAPDQPRLTFLPFIVKAVVQGLRDHPAMNASLDEAAGEIVYHDRFDIGVAVDTDAGLVVPVVRDADKKRLRDVAAEIDRLAAAARDGSLTAEDLRGGTFTVTSPGPFGGLMATPLVFHPQSAILGVHRATERPVVRDGQIVARKMMNLSVTFDHRILDGMTAAKFALDIVKLLEHPMVLALEP
ncbi:MAG: 2-oxo acid dehydrogenase subunit E2 [Actinomycetota bacterium]|nr:2-oxo acid dehydrogenase subunit E2 [Actinomycetota bacterium]